ncbi:MAG: preprotein translocase subunit YajC [Spirochaetia bacterium]|nr:preprotein translocase subunit YajC [Spirochaetia bacterium]
MKNHELIIAQVVSSGDSPAQAPSAPGQMPSAPPGGSSLTLLFPLLLLGVFYFLLIRPQQKKEKERREQLKKIVKGDKVITKGGIWGVIVGIKDEEGIAVIKIADNVKVEASINAIEAINPKPPGSIDKKPEVKSKKK